MTGMMLEKDNEKILQMLENTDDLTRQVKAAVDNNKPSYPWEVAKLKWSCCCCGGGGGGGG